MNENNAAQKKASKSESKGTHWTTESMDRREEALAGLPVLPDRVSDMATLGRMIAELRSAQK